MGRMIAMERKEMLMVVVSLTPYLCIPYNSNLNEENKVIDGVILRQLQTALERFNLRGCQPMMKFWISIRWHVIFSKRVHLIRSLVRRSRWPCRSDGISVSITVRLLLRTLRK